MVQMNIPNMTTKQYDQAWEQMRATGHANPKGLIHHVGSLQGNTLMVVDVWESTDAFAKFGEILGPIMGKLGVPQVEPVITPVHFEYSGK